jgi:hypothetical protein
MHSGPDAARSNGPGPCFGRYSSEIPLIEKCLNTTQRAPKKVYAKLTMVRFAISLSRGMAFSNLKNLLNLRLLGIILLQRLGTILDSKPVSYPFPTLENRRPTCSPKGINAALGVLRPVEILSITARQQ